MQLGVVGFGNICEIFGVPAAKLELCVLRAALPAKLRTGSRFPSCGPNICSFYLDVPLDELEGG